MCRCFVARAVPAALFLPMVCLLLGGCLSSSSPAIPVANLVPFQGQEVELLVPESLGLPATWDVLLQEWSSQSGATVRVAEYAPEQEADARPPDRRVT